MAPLLRCRSRDLSFQVLRLLDPASPSVAPAQVQTTVSEPEVFLVDSKMLSGIVSLPPVSSSMQVSHDAQLRDLHTRWLVLVEEAGSFSTLYLNTAGYPHLSDHRLRAISKFSPATLQGYFAVWERWATFAKFHNVQLFCPPPVLVADFLLSTAHRSNSGSALQSVKALNFQAKRLELPAFLQSLHQSWIRAYQSPTHPTVRREASPLTLSFVVWMEKMILEGQQTVALRIVIGAMLLGVWASLRWADFQWLSIDSLEFSDGILRGLAHRTKTTKRGMPIGIDALGFLGTGPNHCWVQSWLQLVRQAIVDTKGRNPEFNVDFVIPALDGAADRPVFHSPLTRFQGIRLLRTLWASQLSDHGVTIAPPQLTLLGVHSLKVTFLSWSRQLDVADDLRRHQGHHRLDGARGSVALYGRDDVWPCIKLQRMVQSKIRSGFRPLQPVCRGACQPVGDVQVDLYPLPETDSDMATRPLLASPEGVTTEQLSSASDSSSEAAPETVGSSDDDVTAGHTPRPGGHPKTIAARNSSLGPPEECFWLVNVHTSVAHLAAPCDDDFPHRIRCDDCGQWFRFACGTRLSLTDETIELTQELESSMRVCSRFVGAATATSLS